MAEIKWQELSLEKALNATGSNANGLMQEEAEKRLQEFGFNELKEKKKLTALKVLLRQFANFMVYVLFAAALISFSIGEIVNFWVICFIIFFAVVLGFVQEYKAEKAMEALKTTIAPSMRVLRNNRVHEVETKQIVPGDVLVLEAGDKIPADAKVFELIGMRVDESAITGESIAVEKENGSIVYAGTQIVHGKCKALVIATGMQTGIGKIAGLIQETEEQTPMQTKITHLSKTLAMIALATSAMAFFLGLSRGAPLTEMLLVALALAVAAVPEGLPLTLTITLAHGMRTMASRKAIVRKMLGVETLGSTTIICTDKTGTLTKNEMTIEKIFVADKLYEIDGAGYEPKGNFFLLGNKTNPKDDKNLAMLLNAATLCTNAVLEKNHDKWSIVGDPTEASIVVAAAKAGLWKDDLETKFKRTEEIMFTPERKLMTTIHENNGKTIAFTKGAPEILLQKCAFVETEKGKKRLDKDEIQRILNANNELAKAAYRVLGVSCKNILEAPTAENVEKEMTFLGLLAMIDPPREEVKKAIGECASAGIKVVMITGDNEETAKAIAKKICLFDDSKAIIPDCIKDAKHRKIMEDGTITGSELEQLDDNEFGKMVEDIVIYARIMPEQKLRIVKALKQKGEIVAMTGDGVNDAPALKKADIGIAMGLKGTDVAKESSIMILEDDNFATIVEAVKQGRTIYENIEKFACYLISRNFTEVILILLGVALLGFEFLPLIALQILFINTFDEIMPAIGLGLEPSAPGIMKKKPRNPKERLLKKRNLAIIVSTATIMALSCFAVFLLANPLQNIEKARTMVFATIASMVLVVPFAFRSLEQPITKIGLFKNKALLIGSTCTLLITLIAMYVPLFQKIFKLATMQATDWLLPMAATIITVLFIETFKLKIAKFFEEKQQANFV